MIPALKLFLAAFSLKLPEIPQKINLLQIKTYLYQPWNSLIIESFYLHLSCRQFIKISPVWLDRRCLGCSRRCRKGSRTSAQQRGRSPRWRRRRTNSWRSWTPPGAVWERPATCWPPCRSEENKNWHDGGENMSNKRYVVFIGVKRTRKFDGTH